LPSQPLFALLVIGPSLLRRRDVFLLAALRPSRQQNYEPVAILAEIDPVSWPEIDPEFLDPCPTPFTLERLPSSMRVNATATFAAA
jgi:hypothetical protein